MGNISNPSTGVPSPVSGVITFTDGITLGAPSDLGTPSALVGTNITGTAAGLTAGNATNAVTAGTATANVLKDNGSGAVGSIRWGAPAVSTADGATIAGSSLQILVGYTASPYWTLSGTYGAGTWRNVNGNQVLIGGRIGMFQRIA